ncbi:spore coat protein GerQ [Halobacillus seohaensis]|uniref:Spore coat protein GerQ n=1 Tax=Halobacillus seohaensis TaxID=447421 RepID=A0ABW2ELL3_9BACI
MQGIPQGNMPYYPYMYQYGPAVPVTSNAYNNGNNNGNNGGPGPGPANQNGMQVPQMNNGNNGNNGNGMLPEEESYIENILRLNLGKEATVYMTFENNDEWNAKVFKGIVEAAGRDHIIISDPQTGKRYLLLMIYLDYITFDGEINYSYPYNGATTSNGMANYSPR